MGILSKEAGEKGALSDLHRFEARNTRNGLFLRYCRGRVTGFASRQVLTLVGSASLAAFQSIPLGLTTFAIALLGEAVDCALLMRISDRYRGAVVPALWRRLASITALVQGATITACVVLASLIAESPEVRFFSTAFLVGAAINAGVVRPFFAVAADCKLVLYAAALFWIVLPALQATTAAGHLPSAQGHYLVATVMLVYMSYSFIRLVGRTHARNTMFEGELLAERHRLEISTRSLAAKGQQARRLALVAEHANDSVVITGPDGKIEWVNATFSRVTGYDLAEVVGRFPNEFLNSPDTDPVAIAEISALVRDKRAGRVEVLNQAKSGKLIWMEVSLTPILNPDGSLLMTIGIERDITDAKEREAELGRARMVAEDATRAKSSFLATMSHEIRTPMNGVIGMASLLAETSLDMVQQHYVDTIVDSGQSLLTIINDVLDLSKLQSGKPVVHAAPFDLVLCLGQVIDLLSLTADTKGIVLTAPEIAEPVPTLLGDAGRIRQILMNLIGNAVKFTSQGGVTITLTHATEAGRCAVAIGVRDTGIGVAPDRIGLIFDSFTQADDDTTRRFGGTGLGLTISRMLARAMGGDISVTSAFGRGSEFVLQLPLELAEVSDLPKAALVPVLFVPRRANGYRILVAEDNRTNRLIVRKMLELDGVSLSMAENGQRAVELYAEAPPDLILMDVSMPVKDGLQATREIRLLEAASGRRRCPIVALTANAFAEDRAACTAAGLDDFLSKPVSKAELLGRLQAHLGAV